MSDNKQSGFVSAVVYAYNSENSIAEFIKKLYSVLSANFEKFEIVAVNDSSTDNTAKVIKDTALSISGNVITLLTMSYFQGLEVAMNAGVDLAIGDFVFEFDTVVMDYDESYIMRVFERALTGFDIVSAAPDKTQACMSNLFYKLYNNNSGNISKLRTESFRVLSRRAINRIHGMSKITTYRKAAYANCGLMMDCVVYDPLKDAVRLKRDKRERGSRRELAVDSLVLFTNVFYRFSVFMAMLLMGVTLFAGVYAIVIFLAGHPVEGWTTMTLILSVSFFGIFFMFAIVMKYLSILTKRTIDRQKYMFESIEKLSK